MATTSGRINYEDLVRSDRIHAAVYYDPQIFADELEKIWHKGWVYVGHESEAPAAGDYVTKRVGLQPVIMSRSEDNAINLLFNRCIHRGNTVCQYEKGFANAFRCAYHGWTFANSGELIGITHKDGYDAEALSELSGLEKVPRVTEYGGFIFGSLSPTGITLEEHLGVGGRAAIDQLNALSPEGRITISGGMLKHKTRANWKMLYEAQVDGYHPFFAHQSILENVPDKRGISGDTSAKKMGASYLGMGHTELDLAAAGRATGRMFTWLPGLKEERSAPYIKRLEEAYGPERAREILIEGPPHVNIWPNLMLAELNLFIIQPVAVDQSVQYDAPVFIKGVPELDEKILHYTEGAVGPAGFLLADDGEMFQRNFRGFQARSPEWVLLTRGRHREVAGEGGFVSGHSSDEAHYRGYWAHYRRIMTAA